MEVLVEVPYFHFPPLTDFTSVLDCKSRDLSIPLAFQLVFVGNYYYCRGVLRYSLGRVSDLGGFSYSILGSISFRSLRSLPKPLLVGTWMFWTFRPYILSKMGLYPLRSYHRGRHHQAQMRRSYRLPISRFFWVSELPMKDTIHGRCIPAAICYPCSTRAFCEYCC